MSLYDDVIVIDQKREELLQQIQAKLPEVLAERVRALYPTASRLEIRYDDDAGGSNEDMCYAYPCAVYDKDHNVLFDGDIYDIGLDEGNPAKQETIDINPILELGEWDFAYWDQYRQKPRVIEFPSIE